MCYHDKNRYYTCCEGTSLTRAVDFGRRVTDILAKRPTAWGKTRLSQLVQNINSRKGTRLLLRKAFQEWIPTPHLDRRNPSEAPTRCNTPPLDARVEIDSDNSS